MKRITILILCAVLTGVEGCRNAEKGKAVALFQSAGGGDVSQANSAEIAQFLARHKNVRKQITPICRQEQSNAPADWADRDEGKVCAGNTQANFFGKTKVKSDGVAF